MSQYHLHNTIIGVLICICFLLWDRKYSKKNTSKFYKRNKSPNSNKNDADETLKTFPEPKYRKKKYFITWNEKKFYNALRVAIEEEKESIMIHCQVSLIALLEPMITKEKKEEHLNASRHIWAKRLDYVISDTKLNVLAVIELDDSTHNRPERIERDEFVTKALKGKYDLVRFKTERFYEPKKIKERLFAETNVLKKQPKYIAV